MPAARRPHRGCERLRRQRRARIHEQRAEELPLSPALRRDVVDADGASQRAEYGELHEVTVSPGGPGVTGV
jgi:hypothetical protein